MKKGHKTPSATEIYPHVKELGPICPRSLNAQAVTGATSPGRAPVPAKQ